MNLYPDEEVLTGPWLFRKFDPKVIADFISCLTPQNLRVNVTSKTFQGRTTEVELWYMTEYSVHPFSAEFMARLAQPGTNESLHLPPPNDFIATDFSLKCSERVSEDQKETYPTMILCNKGSKLWHKVDDVFGKPKALVICNVTSPTSYASPRLAILTELYIRLVEDKLTEFSYNADLAGLSYSLSPTATGFVLQFGGYNHKLPILAEHIVQCMLSLQVSEERFVLILERLVRGLKNNEKEQPYQHAIYDQVMALEHGRWHWREILAVVPDLSVDLVQQHVQNLFHQTYVEVLMHGNLDQKDAETLHSVLTTHLITRPLLPSQFPDIRLVCLPAGHCYYSMAKEDNKEEENSAVYMYFQIGEDTISARAASALLSHLMCEPCFNQLRTNEQLGYLVHSGLNVQRGVLGLCLIIQSSERGADYLDSRAEAFLEGFHSFLSSMTDDVFRSNVAAVCAQLMEKDENLSQETQRLWDEIE